MSEKTRPKAPAWMASSYTFGDYLNRIGWKGHNDAQWENLEEVWREITAAWKDRPAPAERDLTAPDAEWVATEATRRLATIYRDYGWSPCPRISAGTVRVVLEVARERIATPAAPQGEEGEG